MADEHHRAVLRVDDQSRGSGVALGALVQPVVQLVGRQLLEPYPANLRAHVAIRERPVIVDGSFGPAFQSFGQEIIHGGYEVHFVSDARAASQKRHTTTPRSGWRWQEPESTEPAAMASVSSPAMAARHVPKPWFTHVRIAALWSAISLPIQDRKKCRSRSARRGGQPPPGDEGLMIQERAGEAVPGEGQHAGARAAAPAATG